MSEAELVRTPFAERETRRLQIIADMIATRAKPRQIARRELVEAEHRTYNDRMWAAEHKEMIEREAREREAANRPGFFRRLWRALFA